MRISQRVILPALGASSPRACSRRAELCCTETRALGGVCLSFILLLWLIHFLFLSLSIYIVHHRNTTGYHSFWCTGWENRCHSIIQQTFNEHLLNTSKTGKGTLRRISHGPTLEKQSKKGIRKWDIKARNSFDNLRNISCVLFFKYLRTSGGFILIMFTDTLWNRSVELDHRVKVDFPPVLVFSDLGTCFHWSSLLLEQCFSHHQAIFVRLQGNKLAPELLSVSPWCGQRRLGANMEQWSSFVNRQKNVFDDIKRKFSGTFPLLHFQNWL